MRPHRPLPLVPYLPTAYRATLQAIQTPIPGTARPIKGKRQTIPDLFERQPFDAEKVRRKLLARIPAASAGPSTSAVSDRQNAARDNVQLGERQEGLRRGVPFFRDEAHRRPTRGLYRALLRACRAAVNVMGDQRVGTVVADHEGRGAPVKRSFEGIRAKIRYDWRRYRHLTSIPQTRNFLATQYDLYTSLQSPTTHELAAMDEKYLQSKRLFPLGSRHSADSPSSDRAANALRKNSSRPRLTGGFLRPSHNNPPLPRLRPQPESLSMMINKRHKQQARLKNRVRELGWIKDDMRAETAFWQSLVSDSVSDPHSIGRDAAAEDAGTPADAPGAGLSAEQTADWSVGWNRQAFESIKDIDRQLQCGWKRKLSKFDDGLVVRVMRAKRRREAYLRDRAAAAKQAAKDRVH